MTVLTTGDPEEISFRQSLDALNFMMADQKLPHDNRLFVRDYFRKSKTMLKRKSYFSLIDRTLTKELKGDVRYLMAQGLFTGVWWLYKCERAFLEDLSVYIQREAFAPKEKIPSGPENLNVLMQGVATRGGAILAPGGHWGDVIISSPMLRDTREAKALGYCEISKISREAIVETSRLYPASGALIRQAALKIAVARAMVVIAMYARMRTIRRSLPGRAMAPPGHSPNVPPSSSSSALVPSPVPVGPDGRNGPHQGGMRLRTPPRSTGHGMAQDAWTAPSMQAQVVRSPVHLHPSSMPLPSGACAEGDEGTMWGYAGGAGHDGGGGCGGGFGYGVRAGEGGPDKPGPSTPRPTAILQMMREAMGTDPSEWQASVVFGGPEDVEKPVASSPQRHGCGATSSNSRKRDSAPIWRLASELTVARGSSCSGPGQGERVGASPGASGLSRGERLGECTHVGGDVPSAVRIEQLMIAQAQTQETVDTILGRLSRLDVIAESVAGINRTLKEAARRNNSEGTVRDPAHPGCTPAACPVCPRGLQRTA